MGKWGEMQVGFSCVQSLGGRNRAAVVSYYLVQTILTRSACLVFLAKHPCWTLLSLGWVRAYQPRGPWQSCVLVKVYFHCLSLPSCEAALLKLAYLLHAGPLPSQHKGPWCGLAQVWVSSRAIWLLVSHN
jgi:hypothetical protein